MFVDGDSYGVWGVCFGRGFCLVGCLLIVVLVGCCLDLWFGFALGFVCWRFWWVCCARLTCGGVL